MNKYAKQAFVVLSFVLLIFGVFVGFVGAAGYGEGHYGAGLYEVGDAPATDTMPGVEACDDVVGSGAPWLYTAIAQSDSSIMLYFTEVGDPVDKYVLEFGNESGNYQYGSINIGGKGINKYLVGELQSNTTYYFRVRAGNGCATGSWSNELSNKTLESGIIATSKNLDIVSSELTPVESGGGSLEEVQQEIAQEGYSLNIKVLDTKQNPVKGAKVTIHSKVQETTTDENGVAHFTGVEPGNHKIMIAYNGYSGEQNINLTGDTKEFNLNIIVKPNPYFLSPLAYIIIGVMGIVTFVSVVLLIKSKRRK